MKCTDADNPPCKRCRNGGLECVFEKPIRDTLNNSEQGMWYVSLSLMLPNRNTLMSYLVSRVSTLRDRRHFVDHY